MTKPVLEIEITTAEGKSGTVNAAFDTGSFYTLLREDAASRATTCGRGP